MMASSQSFTTFEQNHLDVVLAVDFNFYGTRMATASADHRVKVYDRKEDNWNLVDTFGAHDAEITDVKWNHPFLGETFGTIAEDGRFKLWQEDLTELPNSGRRFSCIFRASSETRVPFMSLAFKAIHTETYVALTTRDGFLKVLEPIDHEDLTQWNTLFDRYLCPTPERTEETSFKLCWHGEKVPCWTAVRAGLDRKALSLAVTCMNTVKILRTDKDRRFYNVAELREARDLVRDVAWANGSMRGWDTIATASKDGCIRIYELRVEGENPVDSSFGSSSTTIATTDIITLEKSPQPHNKQSQSTGNRKGPSGIGAGLAGSSADIRDARSRDGDGAPGRIKEVAKMVQEINLHRGALWKVAFSQGGDVLASTGDDGGVRTWKRALDGRWHEYAEVDVAGD